jgi:hypothetical protein
MRGFAFGNPTRRERQLLVSGTGPSASLRAGFSKGRNAGAASIVAGLANAGPAPCRHAVRVRATHSPKTAASGAAGFVVVQKTKCEYVGQPPDLSVRTGAGIGQPPGLIGRSRIPRAAGCSHRRIMVDVLGRIDGWWNDLRERITTGR